MTEPICQAKYEGGIPCTLPAGHDDSSVCPEQWPFQSLLTCQMHLGHESSHALWTVDYIARWGGVFDEAVST